MLLGLLLTAALGCSGDSDPTAPPSGWEATDTRMWRSGVDTAKVFRNMASLSDMGITEKLSLTQGGLSQEQFTNAVKRSLIKLYRSNPSVVDSLFDEHAAPDLQNVELGSDAVQEGGKLNPKLLQPNKKKSYQAITDYYKQPKLQKGIENIAYPESLRTQEASGQVQLQVYADTSGAVQAVEVVDGTHPTLNRIAMAAATRTTWEPGYTRQGPGEEWQPVPGWGRVPVNFPAPRN